MDKMLNNNRRDQSDNDPFAVPPPRETASQGSVYETINDYQEAKKHTTMLSQQRQDYQWKLQQLEQVESEREVLEESAYQVMSSASIGDIPDSAGATATSRFTYPQPYPNSPQSPNNPNPLMISMPQQLLAAPNDDNTDPYGYDHMTGYQFRPCPASAAAGSTLSPIHEDHYDNDADVHGQFHHSAVHGNGFRKQATMEELDLSMDEGEQDYTFMSQAGTLTSQTSASMMAPHRRSYTDSDQQICVDTTPGYLHNAVDTFDKNGREMTQYTSIRSKDSQC